MDREIKLLNDIIKNSNSIVFFGGAGVSTASGIPDFRSSNGLYKEKYIYSPETILSHSFFLNNPEEFYQFYKNKMNCTKAEPNIIHQKLIKLEKLGKLKCIITQNIDGLHEKAGSKNTLEIHGSIYRNFCMKCHNFYSAEEVFSSEGVPTCSCGGIIKPDVVLYEEPLGTAFDEAIRYVKEADTLIVAGTSLNVYPAASLIQYFKGKHLILLNKDKTPYDKYATLKINALLQDIFNKINV